MLHEQAKHLDTRQMRILLTLLEQRSVTRTADLLGQTQPYVSLVLRRLRHALGDQLLVRSGAKLVPTDRGLRMVAPLRRALAGIDEIINNPDDFDPHEAECTFTLAAADCMEAFFLPRLISRIRHVAPGVRLMLRSIEPKYDYRQALEIGELDAVIGNWPGPPDNLKRVHLLVDDIVCLLGPQHPLYGEPNISMDAYLRLQHLAPVPLSLSDPGPIDGRLAELGYSRDIRVMVPEFNLVPYVLLSSDLIFTSCRHFADHYSSFLPIATADAPDSFGKMQFYLLWHERSQSAASCRWLRDQIVMVARELKRDTPLTPAVGNRPAKPASLQPT